MIFSIVCLLFLLFFDRWYSCLVVTAMEAWWFRSNLKVKYVWQISMHWVFFSSCFRRLCDRMVYYMGWHLIQASTKKKKYNSPHCEIHLKIVSRYWRNEAKSVIICISSIYTKTHIHTLPLCHTLNRYMYIVHYQRLLLFRMSISICSSPNIRTFLEQLKNIYLSFKVDRVKAWISKCVWV